MTVIAAVTDGTTVTMAADTGETVNGTWTGTARKIRRLELPNGAGTILLAVAGAAGVMTVAARAIHDAPAPTPDSDLDDWADSLAIHLTEACAAATPPLTEPDGSGMATTSGRWLLGYQGRLWHVGAHHATPVTDDVTAIGAGAGLALGWMLAADQTISDAGIVAGAVYAACQRSPYCTAPAGPLVVELSPGRDRDGRETN